MLPDPSMGEAFLHRSSTVSLFHSGYLTKDTKKKYWVAAQDVAHQTEKWAALACWPILPILLFPVGGSWNSLPYSSRLYGE